MTGVGIMQGRLSAPTGTGLQVFPWATWKEEFTRARACGFEAIEWLVTAGTLESNPIWADATLDEIRGRIAETGIHVRSLCADCLIARPFVRVSEPARRQSVDILNRLIVQSARLGAEVVVVPVLEHGEARTDADAALVVESLREPLLLAQKHGIQLGLETDLAADEFRALIERADHASLGACYDTGNAAARGYDVAADVQTLAGHLCAVHIKDRKRNGPSVMLGCGDTDFAAFFGAIATVKYTGPLILETPVGRDPTVTARAHVSFVQDRLQPIHG